MFQLMVCNEIYQGLYKIRYVNDIFISSGKFKIIVIMYFLIVFVFVYKIDISNKVDIIMYNIVDDR